MSADFYPGNMEGKATWHANWAAHLPGLAAKYNLTLDQLNQVTKDNDWIQFWVSERALAATFASQLSSYFNTIAGNDNSLDPPATPAYAIGDAPAEAAPGIEYRVREIARQIKGHSSYAEADGTLLGIIGESGGVQGLGQVQQPTIQCFAALSNYDFAIVVTGRGNSDSWQVWATEAGSQSWAILATATGKSANIHWTPKGEEPAPVMLHVRVQLRRSNQDYGEVSDIAQVTVNP